MPSTYAHYRFGKLLIPALPPDVQQTIGRFRRLYDMGTQGPDIFFYHNPFLKTAAGELGKTFHAMTGKDFFAQAARAAATEAGRAYLYGLLSHYALDSACHPFVNQRDAAGEGKHVPMEKEFDRYLMALDGIAQPHAQPLGEKVKLTRGECVTVAAFFPPAAAGEVNSSVKFMAFALNFLARNRKGLVYSGLKQFYPGLLEHAIPVDAAPGQERVNSELLARFNRSLRACPEMLAQLEAHGRSGEPLGEAFEAIFG